MSGPTHRSTWKARERQAAALFGSKRQRCSGSSGREDCSRSDSTHDRLFIETKLKASNATVTLFDDTKALAKAEGKTPVLLLAKKNRPGFLVVLDSADLAVIMAEFAAARISKGESGDHLEGRIRQAYLAQRGELEDGDDENGPEASPPDRAA
jgi:hypothetical protein